MPSLENIDKSPEVISGMFNNIAPSYDLMNTIMTFGMHYIWRKKALTGIPKVSKSLDICTGTGDFVPLLQRISDSVTALDFSSKMLSIAQRRFSSPSTKFIQGDALNLPFDDNTFDLITIGFGVRNFSNLELGLLEAKRVLALNGILVILETGQAKNIFWKLIEKIHSNIWVPLISFLIARNTQAYQYCLKSTSVFPSGEDFCRVLTNAGFQIRRSASIGSGITYIYHASPIKV